MKKIRAVGVLAAALLGLGSLAACGTQQASPSLTTPSCCASRPTSETPEPTGPSDATASEAPLPTGPSDAAAPEPAVASTTPAPVRLTVPAIGVSTALQGLTLLPDGTLQSPTQWQVAGWYDQGVRPGDPGPAVIAGHVDSVSGPAVFYRLRQLKSGDTAQIARADGSSVVFVIDTVQEFPKDAFPTESVYGPTAYPALRLVTCTGDFDVKTRSYLDNLVVSAHLAGT